MPSLSIGGCHVEALGKPACSLVPREGVLFLDCFWELLGMSRSSLPKSSPLSKGVQQWYYLWVGGQTFIGSCHMALCSEVQFGGLAKAAYNLLRPVSCIGHMGFPLSECFLRV